MEEIINTGKLVNLVNSYGITTGFEEFFRGQKFLDSFKYFNMELVELIGLCKKINKQKAWKQETQFARRLCYWKKGELKLFIWVTLFYSYNQQKPIKQFKTQDFEFLQTVFPSKSDCQVKYQVMNFFQHKKLSKRKWCDEQIKLFNKIVENFQRSQERLQWKSISQDLFAKSQGAYFRTFGQCRQRWVNHMDTRINKNVWTEVEDSLLLVQSVSNNKCWSKIAQKFNGTRSAHMIKNRYHSLLKKSKTTTNKHEQLAQVQQSSQVVNSQSKMQTQFEFKKYRNSNDCLGDEPESILIFNQDYRQGVGLAASKQVSQIGCYGQIQSLGFLSSESYSLYFLKHSQQAGYKCVQKQNQSKFSCLLQCQKAEIAEKLGCSHFQLIEQLFQ